MNIKPEKYIYKIIGNSLWLDSKQAGILIWSEIDKRDKFIHLSTHRQLAETLRLHFRGQSNLIILAIAIKDVENMLKWEKSRNNELFPHLYGELNIDLVSFSFSVDVDDEGEANLPEFLKC